MRKEEIEKKKIECMGKLNKILLGVPPFYRELQKIFMGDHPQVTIVVQNFIFYNITYFIENYFIIHTHTHTYIYIYIGK